MQSPGACQVVAAGQANRVTFVMGKVKQVTPRRLYQPVRRANQAGAIGVTFERRPAIDIDDRRVEQVVKFEFVAGGQIVQSGHVCPISRLRLAT
jgi:hypothetical protein